MVALVAQETMVVALVTPENVVGNLVSRTGRHLQRYNRGRRQVVGLVFFLLFRILFSSFFEVGFVHKLQNH